MDNRTLPPSRPIVQRGDRVLYRTPTGGIRCVLIAGAESAPSYSALVIDQGDHAYGCVVLVLAHEIIAIEPRQVATPPAPIVPTRGAGPLPLVVTFRCPSGIVLDRLTVMAHDERDAITSARQLAIALAAVRGQPAPFLDNPVVGVDLDALGDYL